MSGIKGMHHYYNTCPDCGANLDPGEKCECHTQRCVICHGYVPEGRKVCMLCSAITSNDGYFPPLQNKVKEVHHNK